MSYSKIQCLIQFEKKSTFKGPDVNLKKKNWKFFQSIDKFSINRTAVDTDEIDDYLQYVENPMDFDQMLTKLDNAEYHCAQDFLSDIDLIAENAINYNSDLNYETNKVICHRARALQDFAYALIKADMDTDFEDNCKVGQVYF